MRLGAPIGTAAFQTEAGDRVFFSEDSAELGTRARAAIEAQAAWLLRHPQVSVTIEGHADDPGTPGRNHDLSRQRAQAVRTRLIERGVAPERVTIVAYGRERRVADCPGGLCTAQNRRTVTTLGAAVPVEDGQRRAPRRLF